MKHIEYGFWFWSHKLNGILRMLSSISGYYIDEQEYEIINEELRNTNNEENIWSEYDFSKGDTLVNLKFHMMPKKAEI